MYSRSRIFVVCLSIISLALAACGSSKPAKDDTGSIEGYVYFASRGSLASSGPCIITDSEVASASYGLVAGATVTIDGTELTADTGADGHFSISKVPSGSYTITVTMVDGKTAQLTVTVESGKVATAFEPLEGSLSGYVFVQDIGGGILVSNAAVPPEGYSAKGDATVSIVRNEGVILRKTTDTTGHFAQTIQAGTYELTVTVDTTVVRYSAIAKSGDDLTVFQVQQ